MKHEEAVPANYLKGKMGNLTIVDRTRSAYRNLMVLGMDAAA